MKIIFLGINFKILNYIFLVLILTIFGFFSLTQPVNAATATSTFVSTTTDTGQESDFTILEWIASTTLETDLKFQLRSASTTAGTDSATWYGPTGTSDYYTSSSTGSFTATSTINIINDGDRYFQYKAFFEFNDASESLYFEEIKINYQLYSTTTQDLTSNAYNTTDAANVIASLTWWEYTTTTDNGSSTVKFQLRTATNTTNWTEWYGPTATGTNYFESISAGCSTTPLATSTKVTCITIPTALSDAISDQYVQYIVYLETINTGLNPILYDVQLTYVVNASPQIQSFTASQSGSSVNISYQVRDTDTASGTYPGYVDITLWEYSTDGGATYANASDTCFATTDWATTTVATSPATNWTTTTATWTPTCDIGTSINTAQAVLRITMDDGEAANNTTTATTTDFSLDLRQPTISAVASTTNVATATVTWTTDISANTFIDYGTSTTDLVYLYSSSSESVTSHTAQISNLIASTTYYFQVRSGNTTDNNSGSFYTFTTLGDITAPTTSNVGTSTVSYDSATIVWTTNERSTSQVEYGETVSYGNQTTEDATLVYNHSVPITGLTQDTEYNYRVISKDSSDNIGSSTNQTFNTVAEEVRTAAQGGGFVTDTIPPGIGSIKVTEITETEAKISWSVSENATAKVLYGKTTSYGNTENSLGGGRDHSLTLRDLSPGTAYHFQVEAKDFAGNIGSSADNTFTTLGEGEEELIPGEEEEEPGGEQEEEEEEIITAEKVKEVVEITKRVSTTFIPEIIEALLENPYLKDIEEKTLTDSFSELASKLGSPPQVSGDLPQVEVAATTAKVIWTTDKESNSLVAYVKQTEYDNTKEEPYAVILGNPYHQVTYHQVLIENLEPSTTYHYQVRSQGKIGPITRSEDQTFTTLSQIPKISDIKFVDISPESAIITFNTNLPAKTILTITDTRTGQTTETEDISYLKEHQIQIEDLDISTDYSLTLIAEDEEGTRSLPSILPFSTAISLKPPEITNVRITTSLIPGRTEKVQAIISWKTSKPATSKVYYEEGISQKEELQFFTKEDIILNTDHIVITTAFKPGRVYRFRVQSTDSIGNTSHSKDYTILTPKPKESVLDLIIQNFEQTFSFLQRLRF